MLGSKTSAKQLTPSALVSQRAALEQTIQGLTTKLAEAEAVATDAAGDDAAYRAAAEKVSTLRAELHSQRERAERLDGIMADVAQGEQLRLVAEIETAIRRANAGVNLQDLRSQRQAEEARHEAAIDRLDRLERTLVPLSLESVAVGDFLRVRAMSLAQIETAREIIGRLADSRDGNRLATLFAAAEIAFRELLTVQRRWRDGHTVNGNRDADAEAANNARPALEAKANAAMQERDHYAGAAYRLHRELLALLRSAPLSPDRNKNRGAPFGTREADHFLANMKNSGRNVG